VLLDLDNKSEFTSEMTDDLHARWTFNGETAARRQTHFVFSSKTHLSLGLGLVKNIYSATISKFKFAKIP